MTMLSRLIAMTYSSIENQTADCSLFSKVGGGSVALSGLLD
jgi:hypothetical protein